jgi:hypothetical protein
LNRSWLFLVALVLLSPKWAQAANIAILRPLRDSAKVLEALHRVQGELLSLGLDVRVVERPTRDGASAEDERAELERLAGERGMDAMIDVVGDTRSFACDIWIFDPSSHRARVARVEVERNAAHSAETLAIRTIEVLRSNFVEIDLAARARSGEPPPPPPRDQAPVKPQARRESVGFEAGIAVLASLDGIDPALLPLARFDWVASSWLVAQASLAGLGTRPTIQTDLGSATVSQAYGLVGLSISPVLDAVVRPVLGLSAGVLRTSFDGDASLPEVGHVVDQWSFLVDASLGVRLALSTNYYLAPAFHVQLAQPYVQVYFVDEEVASSGRPNLLASLTLGLWL